MEPVPSTEFGSLLKRCRVAVGRSQEALAERALGDRRAVADTLQQE